MRTPHWLYRPRQSPLPRYLFFVDVESAQIPLGTTENGKQQVAHVFDMGFAAYTRRREGLKFDQTQWLEIDEPENFWKWVDTKLPPKSVAYVFAHNWGFDFPVLRGYEILPKLGWALTSFIIDDPPTIIDYEKCPQGCGKASGRYWRKESGCKAPHRKIRIIDTLNYFRMSLKALGAAIGTFKLEMPRTESGEPAPITPENIEIWREYNKQDVQVLIDAVAEYLRFVQDHDLGAFAVTQASQSFAAFRHRFMDHRILIDSHEKALALSRNAYYGGRVECFQMGERYGLPTHKLDINSMYPFVMSEFEYPTQFATIWKHLSVEEYNEKVRGKYLACASVLVETNERVYPKRMENKLVFPIGRFRTFLSTPELEYAIDHGHILEIREISLYHHDPIFKKFVDYFYKLRLEAKSRKNTKDDFFLKIMMNSLYGKFGQNGRKWETLEANEDVVDMRVWSEIDFDTGEVQNFRQLGSVVQQLQTMDESMHSHPAIAAHVTAYARMYLWKLIGQAGLENVYYCDTDSVFTNDDGLNRLHGVLDSLRLGALKHEDTTTELEIRGLKDYRFGKSNVIKGVRNPNDPVAPDTYALLQFRGLRGALRDRDFSRVIVTTGVKHLTRKYSKGTVTETGRVDAFELSEPELP